MDDDRITALEAVPEDSTFLFRIEEEAGEEREAILVRADGEVRCWINECQHMTHISLDKGSGATMRNGEIVCENHGAYFDGDTGQCTYGPCEGAYLPDLEISLEGGDVYLIDDDYVFAGVGPKERDDLDRGSKSNLEF